MQPENNKLKVIQHGPVYHMERIAKNCNSMRYPSQGNKTGIMKLFLRIFLMIWETITLILRRLSKQG